MALKSMTGFARSAGSNEEAQWSIELRTVNHKGLDLRVRVPSGMDTLDAEMKKRLSTYLNRGSVTLNLNLKKQQTISKTELNVEAFTDLLNAAKQASEISSLPMPDLGTLLTSRNILKETEIIEDEAKNIELQNQILQSFDKALEDLIKARSEEGNNLHKTFIDRLVIIKDLVTQAEICEERQPEAIRQRLKTSIAQLQSQSEDFDEARLHQEAMIITTRIDIAEELDRLHAHVKQAEDLLNRDEPVGRRLDFLCQEFNREANTICSKANAKNLTYIGLELKTIIDQLREQVQNIE